MRTPRSRPMTASPFVLALGLLAASQVMGTAVAESPPSARVPAPATQPAQPAGAPTPDQGAPDQAMHDQGAHDPTNAALYYYKAWLLIPEATFNKVGEARPSPLGDWVPDAETSKLITDADPGVGLILRAAPLTECSFGMEWSQGVDALLPHLGKLRATARLLSADLRRCVNEGRADDACVRAAALLDMSRHGASEPVLISALVSVAVFTLAADEIGWLEARGQVTPAGRAAIKAALERMDRAELFGVKQAVRNEKLWAAKWLARQAQGPDAGVKLARKLTAVGGGKPDGTADARDRAVVALDESGVKADIARAEAYYDLAVLAFDQPDAADRLRALEAEAVKGAHGVVVQVIGPAFSKVQQAYAKAAARYDELLRRYR